MTTEYTIFNSTENDGGSIGHITAERIEEVAVYLDSCPERDRGVSAQPTVGGLPILRRYPSGDVTIQEPYTDGDGRDRETNEHVFDPEPEA